MQTISTTMVTAATFSDDRRKRFVLSKIWDNSLPKLTICMLAPSIASGIEMDATTSLVLNNASKLGFGSVAIVNLFATLGDFSLSQSEDADPENMKAIVDAAKAADVVIYAPGTGKAKLPIFQQRSKQVLEALRPYEAKLKTLTSPSGKPNFHPLCPSARYWRLAELRIDELLPQTTPVEPKQPKKKGRPTVMKKEASV